MAPRHARLRVLGIVSTFAWRCRTKSVLLPFFRKNVGHKHLDIGVGTGYYLHHANLPADTQVALLDLNANSLEVAKRRFGRNGTPCVLHIFKPLPSELGKFDSMSMFYFFHCLPGSPEDKYSIFEHLKRNLTENGCVYGANILGKDVKHNLFGKTILKFGNKDGFFHNMVSSTTWFLPQHRGQQGGLDRRIERAFQAGRSGSCWRYIHVQSKSTNLVID